MIQQGLLSAGVRDKVTKIQNGQLLKLTSQSLLRKAKGARDRDGKHSFPTLARTYHRPGAVLCIILNFNSISTKVIHTRFKKPNSTLSPGRKIAFLFPCLPPQVPALYQIVFYLPPFFWAKGIILLCWFFHFRHNLLPFCYDEGFSTYTFTLSPFSPTSSPWNHTTFLLNQYSMNILSFLSKHWSSCSGKYYISFHIWLFVFPGVNHWLYIQTHQFRLYFGDTLPGAVLLPAPIWVRGSLSLLPSGHPRASLTKPWIPFDSILCWILINYLFYI